MQNADHVFKSSYLTGSNSFELLQLFPSHSSLLLYIHYLNHAEINGVDLVVVVAVNDVVRFQGTQDASRENIGPVALLKQ